MGRRCQVWNIKNSAETKFTASWIFKFVLALQDSSKRVRKHQKTRKVGCPARISLREIHKFPEFKISVSPWIWQWSQEIKIFSAFCVPTVYYIVLVSVGFSFRCGIELSFFFFWHQRGQESDYYRSLKSKDIRRAILNQENVGERRIYVSLPSITDHSGHDLTRVIIVMFDH